MIDYFTGIMTFTVPRPNGTLMEVKESITSKLFLHYVDVARRLYDRMEWEAYCNGTRMRENQTDAAYNLTELVYKSVYHKNDPKNYRRKKVWSLDEELWIELQDAAVDYGYKWFADESGGKQNG